MIINDSFSGSLFPAVRFFCRYWHSSTVAWAWGWGDVVTSPAVTSRQVAIPNETSWVGRSFIKHKRKGILSKGSAFACLKHFHLSVDAKAYKVSAVIFGSPAFTSNGLLGVRPVLFITEPRVSANPLILPQRRITWLTYAMMNVRWLGFCVGWWLLPVLCQLLCWSWVCVCVSVGGIRTPHGRARNETSSLYFSLSVDAHTVTKDNTSVSSSVAFIDFCHLVGVCVSLHKNIPPYCCCCFA